MCFGFLAVMGKDISLEFSDRIPERKLEHILLNVTLFPRHFLILLKKNNAVTFKLKIEVLIIIFYWKLSVLRGKLITGGERKNFFLFCMKPEYVLILICPIRRKFCSGCFCGGGGLKGGKIELIG